MFSLLLKELSFDFDFNTRNQISTAKLLKQGYRYHKLRKTFSKFYRRHYDLVSKFNTGLKSLLKQGLSELEFYADEEGLGLGLGLGFGVGLGLDVGLGLGLGLGLGFYGVLLTLGGVLVTLKWHNGDLVTFSSMAIFDPGNL